MECLKLDGKTRCVRVREFVRHLTPSEYGILRILAGEPGRTFSPEELYRGTWEGEPFDCRRIVAVHIRHLREKIEKDPSNPQVIRSAWGKGYYFPIR